MTLSLIIDILIVLFLALGGYYGWKAGVLKALVKFVGLIAIAIISFTLKGYLSTIFIKYLPFINLGGVFNELYSINIFVYNALAFLIIFILLYCVLNIILSITGFLNTLLKFTIVWILPSKILGAIVGVLEAWVFILLALFVLAQIPYTTSSIYASNIAPAMMKYTPLIGPFVEKTANSMEEIYVMVKDGIKEGSIQDLDLQILVKALGSGIVTKDQLNELIDEGKIEYENVSFG